WGPRRPPAWPEGRGAWPAPPRCATVVPCVTSSPSTRPYRRASA
ncbi:MAG: hypothetical protein AVDCRST_MAG66-617, partial [uncultured Pseudonocardia sp.]